MENELVLATWALFGATALMAVAGLVPLTRDVLDRRERRREIASEILPDMKILRERVAHDLARSLDVRGMNLEDVQFVAESVDEEVQMASELIESGVRPSLDFVSETYLLQHHLTQARISFDAAETSIEWSDENGETVTSARDREDLLRHGRRSLKAAILALDAAEALLPEPVRSIKGEDFWKRFDRLRSEREAEAEKSLINLN